MHQNFRIFVDRIKECAMGIDHLSLKADLVILISYFFVLLVYTYQLLKNKDWFLISYIAGISLQFVWVILLTFSVTGPMHEKSYLSDLMLVLSYPLIVYSILSYQGYHEPKLLRDFLVSGILAAVLILSLGRNQNVQPWVIAITISFYFVYGGVYLLKIQDKSKIRYFMAHAFFANAMLHSLLGVLIFFRHSDFFSSYTMHQVHELLDALFASFLYVIIFLLSYGFLLLLKEKVELSLVDANRSISKENVTLKQLDEEKNNFFSIVAHDLKGPIGTLANISEMLVDSKKQLQREDYEKWLDLIHQSATRTYTFLNNLLHWARSEAGRLVINPENLELHELISTNLKLLSPNAVLKKIELINTSEKGLMVYADKEMVMTILRNLISNAIKYTYEGGSIRVSTKKEKNPVICIEDNGTGMSKDTVKKLFKLQTSFSTQGTNNEQGTGLGLKLTQEFVMKNKGKIWVKSEEGKGSQFCFSLPGKKSELV